MDKLGRPIYIKILSKVQLDEVFKLIFEQNLVKYYIQEYERVMKYRFPVSIKLKGTRRYRFKFFGKNNKIFTNYIFH